MPGRRIKALRQDRAMSRAVLAGRLGITTDTLGSYEQGRRIPDAGMLAELARVLGVSADYLLTGIPVTGADLTAAARYALSGPAPADPTRAAALALLKKLTGI